MKKLALVIGLVVILVGSVMGGLAPHANAATPTLKAWGSTAPGTVTITGTNWIASSPVFLYMDVPGGSPPFPTIYDTYEVAVATPGSNGVFVATFTVGPTSLGNHIITAVQGANSATATFTITNSSQVDNRVAAIKTYAGNFDTKTNIYTGKELQHDDYFLHPKHISITIYYELLSDAQQSIEIAGNFGGNMATQAVVKEVTGGGSTPIDGVINVDFVGVTWVIRVTSDGGNGAWDGPELFWDVVAEGSSESAEIYQQP